MISVFAGGGVTKIQFNYQYVIQNYNRKKAPPKTYDIQQTGINITELKKG